MIIEMARDQGLAGATADRGVMGFGHATRIHSAHVLDVSENLPVVVKIIDDHEKIVRFTEAVRPMGDHLKIVTWAVDSI